MENFATIAHAPFKKILYVICYMLYPSYMFVVVLVTPRELSFYISDTVWLF